MKGSYFPGEDYDFESSPDKILTFVDMLKECGCYIASDGHIRNKKGGLMSKLARNGYWLTMAQFNKKFYYFFEHRVIWVWHNGVIPENAIVNHKDCNKSNNHIENLELLIQKENAEHEQYHSNSQKGNNDQNAKPSNNQAQAIRALGNVCGWNARQINSILDTPMSLLNIHHIINGRQYDNIVDDSSILEVLPTIVDFTRNKSIGIDEELKNYALGLSGEVGEFNDLIKKMFYHGKDVQPVDIALELGDILYYLVAICNVLGFDFSEIALNNNAKLMARYPYGFSVQKSNDRIEEEMHK